MLKKVCILIVASVVAATAQGQFYKALVPSADFNNALEKVVSDFRYNFKNISGDTLSAGTESETLKSTIELPGATECVIYKFHSAKDTTASWQAVIYNGDEYGEAVKAYKNTVRLLQKSRLQLIDKSIISFAGKLEEPAETLRFTVSTLQLNIEDYRYKKFRAQVEIVSTFAGWTVNLNLHNIKPDEEG